MSSNTVAIKELLNTAEQLGTKELSVLSKKVNEMLAKRPRIGLPKQEARLLLRINEGLPIELLERANLLQQLGREKTLSAIEEKELLELTEQIEELHLKRMKLLFKLAQLRGISLKMLMQELGITPFAMHG